MQAVTNKVTIRKSGGARIISIPKYSLEHLNLQEGDELECVTTVTGIKLTPITEEMTLDSLLAGSPKELLVMTDEDREWMNAGPMGEELI